MRTFDYSNLPEQVLNPEISSVISAIHEYKGKQDLYIEAKPDALDALLSIAKIQSTDASNRIEGISTSDARLKAIVQEKTEPKNRSEKEIAGYRDVLNTIHENHDFISLTPNMILQLHRDLYGHLSDGIGGTWKNADNIISEIDSAGRRRVRFAPAPAFETPALMESLCENYNLAIAEARHDPLLLTAMFVFDFLCIHPFNDGNGRMSRLLTLLLLYRRGYIVGKYISLEMLIEKSKETYYETLQNSSVGWHDATNNLRPFTMYLLGVILKAYREFEACVKYIFPGKTSKADRIRLVIDNTVGKITKKQILMKCPDVSEAMIEKTLKQLLDSGFVKKTGAGKNTGYFKP